MCMYDRIVWRSQRISHDNDVTIVLAPNRISAFIRIFFVSAFSAGATYILSANPKRVRVNSSVVHGSSTYTCAMLEARGNPRTQNYPDL